MTQLARSLESSAIEKSVLVTGAAGSVGSALADQVSVRVNGQLELADKERNALVAVANRTRASQLIIGDLFGRETEARASVEDSEADVIVLNAAINLDTVNPVESRLPLRQAQNAAMLERLKMYMKQIDSTQRRLLIVVNSIAAIFGDMIESAKPIAEENHWHYPLMKGDQSKMLRDWRYNLFDAGVDLCVMYPGAINSDFTNTEEALTNANAMGKKIRGYRGRKNLKQTRVLQPEEVAEGVCDLILHWSHNGEVPHKAHEWIILEEGDCAFLQESAQNAKGQLGWQA